MLLSNHERISHRITGQTESGTRPRVNLVPNLKTVRYPFSGDDLWHKLLIEDLKPVQWCISLTSGIWSSATLLLEFNLDRHEWTNSNSEWDNLLSLYLKYNATIKVFCKRNIYKTYICESTTIYWGSFIRSFAFIKIFRKSKILSGLFAKRFAPRFWSNLSHIGAARFKKWDLPNMRILLI